MLRLCNWLSEERTRYSKLQQSTDSELETLRQQQVLRNQLNLTTRKLENLTDIERRLSSRKSASSDIQGNAHPAYSGPVGEEKSATDDGAAILYDKENTP